MGITTNLLCLDCNGEKERPLAYRCNACNKLHIKNRVTNYYKNNRDRLLKASHKYYAEHKEHAREMARMRIRRLRCPENAGKVDVEQHRSGK